MSKLIVTENTYPKHDNVVHAEVGDMCQWERVRTAYALKRLSDGATLFLSPPVDQNGLLRSTGKQPKSFGVIAQVKSRGWIFEVQIEDGNEQCNSDSVPDSSVCSPIW